MSGLKVTRSRLPLARTAARAEFATTPAGGRRVPVSLSGAPPDRWLSPGVPAGYLRKE